MTATTLRILSTSSNNRPFTGSEGELFNITFKTDPTLNAGMHTVQFKGIEISPCDGAKLLPADMDLAFYAYYIPGDANHDHRVSIADPVVASSYILARDPDPFHFLSADVNEDKTVSVSDVVLIGNIILGAYTTPDIKFALPRMRGSNELSASVVESRNDGTRTIAIALDNSTDYTAFQADLQLPRGMKVTSARLTDRAGRHHSLDMNMVDDNTVRLISFAGDNSLYDGNSGDLLLIDVKGCGEINVTNALFCEPNGCEHELDEITIFTELSGINDITVGNAPVNVYNTAGQLIRTNVNPETATQGLPAGFYIVGDKKVVVK